MPPKRTTTTTTAPMTNAAIKQLIAQGVADALAEIEANRTSRNGDDSHDSGTGSRRTERADRVKGTNVVNYTQCFQELPLMCGRMFPEESDKVEKYVDGLPDMIQGTENKRKLDNENQAQQQPPKKQNVARAYSAGSSEKKEYARTLPLYNKSKFHYNGPCTIKCANCMRVAHLTRDCWSPAATNNQRTLTCYECGNQGHYKSDCPELKNRNHGNQAGGTEARGMVYALGGGETDQDLDNMEDDINA
ncbi:reverse transcriptase domain-containing protein [Tanacetum coccineum]